MQNNQGQNNQGPHNNQRPQTPTKPTLETPDAPRRPDEPRLPTNNPKKKDDALTEWATKTLKSPNNMGHD